MYRRNKDSLGVASFVATLYLAVLSLFSAVFISSLDRAIARTTAQECQLKCRCAAESGIEKAIASLRADPDYQGEKELLFEENRVSTVITHLNGLFHVESIAERTGDSFTRRRISVDLQIGSSGVNVIHWEEENRW